MKKLGGSALILLGLLMAVGFTQAELSQSAGVIFLTLCLAVGLPLGSGGYLLWSAQGHKKGKAQLAEKTLQAEILKLAAQKGGQLTVLEVTQAYALEQAQAEAALDALALKRLAEHQLTDEGLLVYSFPEIQQLKHKHEAKRLEDFL